MVAEQQKAGHALAQSSDFRPALSNYFWQGRMYRLCAQHIVLHSPANSRSVESPYCPLPSARSTVNYRPTE